ncbi:MAG: hypothetical protein AUI01_01310 [Ktedonobacter sp. 13_2_20CM_2_56_8]|nr:MAG: hypothetical protein AUI01_01310 [Ktedonobacter sp. 13_2_20CM_2_56_8]
MIKRFAILVSALALFVLQSQSVFACGGLIAPNGAIRLSRAATLVAWHDGIERYMTSFTYQGDVSKLGWIVPLPAVPLKIEEGGGWTLQRLALETRPQPIFARTLNAAAPTAGVQVLQQVKIEALDITVIKGSHQLQGDGAPILITMKIPHIWIPLEVLALDGQQVQADIYLLTDIPVNTGDLEAKVGQSAVGAGVPGAPGMKLSFQEKMTPLLYHDLSTDRNMGWVRPDSWLTYLSLDTPSTTVTYDMGITSTGIIRLAHFGTSPMAVADGQSTHELPAWLPTLPMGTPQVTQTLALLLVIVSAIFLAFRVRARIIAKR